MGYSDIYGDFYIGDGDTITVTRPSRLGCGTWTAAVFFRGGLREKAGGGYSDIYGDYYVGDGTTSNRTIPPVELTVTQLSLTRVLNRTGDARLTLACSDVEIRPWEHEVHLYRDGSLEAIGIPAFPSHTQTEIEMDLRDLSAWFDRRMIERDLGFNESDLGDIFLSIAEVALERDPSPDITIDVSDTGIFASRLVQFVDRRMAGEELRDLVPLGLDWTVYNRTVIARGRTDVDFLPGYLLDDHLDKRSSAPLFETYSEVTVLGETENVVGTYGGVDERIGLVQTVLTDQSRILDDITATEVAQVTVEHGGSEPLELNGTLLPDAGYAFSDLIPGRVMDVRCTTGARVISQFMRLEEVDVQVRPGTEEVTVRLVSV